MLETCLVAGSRSDQILVATGRNGPYLVGKMFDLSSTNSFVLHIDNLGYDGSARHIALHNNSFRHISPLRMVQYFSF